MGFAQQSRNPPHAAGEWRLPYFEQNVFQTTSNVVALLPTKFEAPEGGWTPGEQIPGWGLRQQDKAIGIRMSADYVIQTAYNWNSKSRILFRNAAPSGQFDFIANVPTGAFEALQQEVKRQWGLAGERQTFQTNAMLLVVSRADVLKPRTPGVQMQSQPNTINFGTIQNMASFLENIVNKPIVDQTSLTGMFQLQFPMDIINGPRMRGGTGTDERLGSLRKYLEDTFGLGLVETNAPVEMLVVRKVGEPVQAAAKGNAL